MTIQHGIDHLKKHDSPKNRVVAAMLKTILEQLGEDIPLPNKSEAAPHKYSVDVPKKVGFTALADHDIEIPNLNPDEINDSLTEQAGYAAQIIDFAQDYINAGLLEVPPVSENKKIFGLLRKSAKTESYVMKEIESIGYALHFYTETSFNKGDEYNDLHSITTYIDCVDKKTKSDLKVYMLLNSGNLETVGFKMREFGDGNRYLNDLMNREFGFSVEKSITKSTFLYLNQGEYSLSNGELSLNLQSRGCDITSITYDAADKLFCSRVHRENGSVELGADIEPNDFVQFAQNLLKLIPLQHF